jgi:cholestenol Delta-isomerase
VIESASIAYSATAGTIHFFFEGYFAVNHHRMPSQQDLFGQLWKEYAYSDSRYMTSDPFVLCMESITAVSLHPYSISAGRPNH